MTSLDEDSGIPPTTTRTPHLTIPVKDEHESESTAPARQFQFESTNTEISDHDSRRGGRHSDSAGAPTLKDGNRYTPPLPIPDPRPSQFHYERGILYLVYVGALVSMYPSLTQLAQLKFQNKHSPFETHAFFAYTSVVAYVIAIPTSIILFYVEASEERLTNERFFCIFYIALKGVFFFFGILAPLSLVLVLLIPHGFNRIGFSIMFALLVAMVAFVFNNYKNLPHKQGAMNLEVVQRGETSTHSTVPSPSGEQ